jgi:hypothetical protein
VDGYCYGIFLLCNSASADFYLCGMQVTYIDLLETAADQNVGPEDNFDTIIAFYEAFAAWAGFKNVEEFYDWRLELDGDYEQGPDGIAYYGGFIQEPREINFPEGFSIAPLYLRAESQCEYLAW